MAYVTIEDFVISKSDIDCLGVCGIFGLFLGDIVCIYLYTYRYTSSLLIDTV